MKKGWSWWLGFSLGVVLVFLLLRYNIKVARLAEQQEIIMQQREIIMQQQKQIAELSDELCDVLRDLRDRIG